jgi:hypothetical protein
MPAVAGRIVDLELSSELILVIAAGVRKSAVSESETSFAHRRDRVLSVLASLLTVSIIVVMWL